MKKFSEFLINLFTKHIFIKILALVVAAFTVIVMNV